MLTNQSSTSLVPNPSVALEGSVHSVHSAPEETCFSVDDSDIFHNSNICEDVQLLGSFENNVEEVPNNPWQCAFDDIDSSFEEGDSRASLSLTDELLVFFIVSNLSMKVMQELLNILI